MVWSLYLRGDIKGTVLFCTSCTKAWTVQEKTKIHFVLFSK